MREYGDIARNFSAGSFGQVINVLVLLFSVPILIGNWGLELYATWMVVYAIPAYLSLSDLGVGAAIGNAIAHENGNATKYFGAGLIMLGVVAGAVSLGAFLANSVFDFVSAGTLGLVVLLSFVLLLFNYFVSVLRGLGRYSFGLWNFHLSRAVDGVLIVSLSYFTSSPADVFVAIIAVKILFLLRLWGSLKPSLTKWADHSDWRLLRKLIKASAGFAAMPVAFGLNNQGLLWVTSYLFDPAIVVLFGTMRTLTRSIYQASGVVSQSFWPLLSKLYANGLPFEFRDAVIRCFIASFSLVLVASLGLLLLIDPIREVWLGGAVEINWMVFSSFIGINVIASLWQPFQIALVATSSHFSFTVAFLLSQLAVVGLLTICAVPFQTLLSVLIAQEVLHFFLALSYYRGLVIVRG